jgi:hypothetical protein
MAVADHQPAAVGVDLVGVGVDVGRDLGPQRRRQHLPGAVAHDLIEQRPAGLVGLGSFLNYREHQGVPPRTSAPTPALDQDYWTSDHPREGAPSHVTRPKIIHRF